MPDDHRDSRPLTDRCAHCPLNELPEAQDVPCVAQVRKHPPYCWAMDPAHPQRNPAFKPVIIDRSLHPSPAPKGACGSCSGQATAPAHSVAVVVISHNYGRYLAEALESALAQTVKAAEVVVVDDASADDTAAIAARYAAKGVRYLRTEHRHVHRARAAGLAATKAPILCFLDADDVLPPDYLAGAGLFREPAVGIVYTDVEYFGSQTGRTQRMPHSAHALELENYIHAGSLVRREALQRADPFAGAPPDQAYADWWLWQCVLASGFSAVKGPALYRYRRHPDSMLSHYHGDYYAKAHLARAEVTIFTPLSGRVRYWRAYWHWLKAQTWPREQVRLVLADTSNNDRFHALVRRGALRLPYPDVRVYRQDVGQAGLADRERLPHREAVRLAMARIYGRLARELQTPYVLVVEDDVLPSPDVIRRLLQGLDKDVAAVAAPYPSRFIDGTVTWDQAGRIPAPRGTGLQEIGGSGFGCTLLRRATLAGETFVTQPGETGDYDRDVSKRWAAKGWKWRVDWDYPATHAGLVLPKLD